MISVEQAQTTLLELVRPLPARNARLGASIVGLTLGEDVFCDADSPPFDKAMMDGFALRSADCAAGQTELEIIEEVSAGRVPTRAIGAGQATQIMTGAPVPEGADAVVMIERCLVREKRVQVQERPRSGQNILERGREMRMGEKVLPTGAVLRPQELGVLASVGQASVQVIPRPVVTVLSTGDEIVEVHDRPGPGQIRNSNGMMLLAQAQRAGATCRSMQIVPDRRERLRLMVQQGLDGGDVVLLSGGVSMGKLDLVPEILTDLGVQLHVHKVRMKPGKPMHFGVWENGGRRRYVFGLPGNPVSSLVCFELFVRPALRKMRGVVPGPCIVSARLESDFPYRTDRTTYYPARLELNPDGWSVKPVPWFGSPDLRGTTAANAFLVLPEGDRTHPAGERYSVLRIEDDWIY